MLSDIMLCSRAYLLIDLHTVSLDDYWRAVTGAAMPSWSLAASTRTSRSTCTSTANSLPMKTRRTSSWSSIQSPREACSSRVFGITGYSRQAQPRFVCGHHTDDPTPEVAATGHQRTIITIQEKYLSEWLSPNALGRERLEHILSDKELPYYVHQIAA
jgi:hypothetical protein